MLPSNKPRKLRVEGFNKVELIHTNWSLESCWAFFQGFFSAKKDYELVFPQLAAKDYETLQIWIACSTFMRDLINKPANDLTPHNLVHTAAEFLHDQATQVQHDAALTTEILEGGDLLNHQYFGTYTVGKSSTLHQPAVLEVDYNPTGDHNAPVFACLIGKGITFDSGGYSIKPSASMLTMRTDMGGAGLVIAALGLAIRTGLQKRVKLFVCSAENMISDTAMKLGDIITYANHKTVEILNTDAEGRLVLADGLIHASQTKPHIIIDCATLTGAAKIALGNDYHALLSRDDTAAENFLAVAHSVHEAFWRLPLTQSHTDVMLSNYADMGNIATPPGAGASTAAGFLANFVDTYQGWLHIDCSATFRVAGSKAWGTGATGIGMRSIATFLSKESL